MATELRKHLRQHLRGGDPLSPASVGLAAAALVLLLLLLCGPRAEAEAIALAAEAAGKGRKRAEEVAARVACVARYTWLTPYELLGWTDCGDVWKLVVPRGKEPGDATQRMSDSMGRVAGSVPECWYFNHPTGEYMQVPCPAPGDTLSVREVPTRSE